ARGERGDGRGDGDHRDEIGVAQYDLFERRRARVYGGAEVAAALSGRYEDTQGREHGGTVRELDPAVHGEWGGHAGFRQREWAAGIRGGRFADRQDAASRRGAGVQAGEGEAARLPEPRDRADA